MIREVYLRLDNETKNYKQKMRDIEGKAANATAKQTELSLNFEKERAKWELEKSYLINVNESAKEAQQRLRERVELLLVENEKIKNDNRSRKHMLQTVAKTGTIQGANILGKLESFAAKGGLTGQPTSLSYGANIGK